jgi:putative MFS transporter
MDGTNFTLVAPILVKNWHLTLTQVGYINSLFFIGMFAGGILGGWYFSNVLGRRKTILISILIFSLSSILNGSSNGFLSFLVFRFITGLGAASLIVVSNLYLVEMLPGKSRGKWQALAFGLAVISLPFLSILNKSIIKLGADSWRILYFIGGLGIISFFLGLAWIKESPRWLVSKGRTTEAEKIFENITGVSKTLLSEQTNRPTKSISIFESFKLIFSAKYKRNTWVLISIFWVGYPAYTTVLYWLPVLFSQKGYSLEDTATFSIFFATGLSVASFFAAGISDLGGRKWTIVVLYMIAILLSFVYGHLETKGVIFAFSAFLVLTVQATNPITSTYLAELYPTNLRSTAVGFIYSVSRLLIAAVQLVISIIVVNYGQVGVFNFLAFIFLVPVVVVSIWGKKTSGQSLENIGQELNQTPIEIKEAAI